MLRTRRSWFRPGRPGEPTILPLVAASCCHYQTILPSTAGYQSRPPMAWYGLISLPPVMAIQWQFPRAGGLLRLLRIMHFPSSLLFHLTVQYFTQQEIYFSRLSCFCFLNSDLNLACVSIDCIAIMLQTTAGWETFYSWIFPKKIFMSSFWQHLLFCIELELLSSASS